jgi:hypothetical protein
MVIFIGFIPPILFMPEFIPPMLPIVSPMLLIEFIPAIPMFMGVVEVLARMSLLDFMPMPIPPPILMPIPPPPMFMFIPS